MCKYRDCRVPSEPGEELCILHMQSPKDVERFKEILYLQIDEKGAKDTRNQRFCFAGYHFPCGLHTSSSAERMTTPYAILPTVMGNLDFRNAMVEGSVILPGATIQGHVFFSNAVVQGTADFNLAKMEGEAFFDGATIQSHAFFSNAKIRGSAIFHMMKIGGNFVSDFATIQDHVIFTNVTAAGSVDFRNAKIGGSASFNCTTVEGDAFLTNAMIQLSADFKDATLKAASYFDGCSARSINLGSYAPRLLGWSLSMQRCGIVLCDVMSASSFWRFARLTFAKNEERKAADAAFYFEMIWHWRALRKVEVGRGTRCQSIRTAFLRGINWARWAVDCVFWRWTTAYGASIPRILATWLLVIGVFGILFSTLPRFIESPDAQVWSLRTWVIGLHYSVTTFATLGLGHIGPGSSRLGMVLTSIEALLGAFLIALAVLVIGRRSMR